MTSVTQMSFQSKAASLEPPFLRNDSPAEVLFGSSSFPQITNYRSCRAEASARRRISVLNYQSLPSCLPGTSYPCNPRNLRLTFVRSLLFFRDSSFPRFADFTLHNPLI